MRAGRSRNAARADRGSHRRDGGADQDRRGDRRLIRRPEGDDRHLRSTGEEHLAGARISELQAGNDAKQGRLAGTGGTQQRQQFDAQLFLRQRQLAPQVDSLRAGDCQKLRKNQKRLD